MERSASSKFRKWIHNYDDGPSVRCRLFCLPHAGGNASVYRPWQGPLGRAGIQVCPVELPGRLARSREPSFTALEPLVETLGEILAPALSRPFALFGYSMGAVVAFELARQLRRNWLPAPELLVVGARQAPQLPPRATRSSELSDDELLARVGLLYGALPGPVLEDLTFRRLIAAILRNDLGLLDRYRYLPEAPLETPIVALGGREDATVGVDQLAAWGTQTKSFRMVLFDGGHFFINGFGTEIIEELCRSIGPSPPRSGVVSEDAGGIW